MFPGLDLHYADPAQHPRRAGEELDDLDHDLSDLLICLDDLHHDLSDRLICLDVLDHHLFVSEVRQGPTILKGHPSPRNSFGKIAQKKNAINNALTHLPIILNGFW